MNTQRTTGIQTFLWFATESEEAARFYVSIFPDSRIDRVFTMPTAKAAGAPVKVVEFTLRGQSLVAMTAGPHDPFNHAISLLVWCKDQAEVDRYWNALSAGGATEACGWLKDKYGVSWQIAAAPAFDMFTSPDREAAKRAEHAMMQMVKFDVGALQRAFDGK